MRDLIRFRKLSSLPFQARKSRQRFQTKSQLLISAGRCYCEWLRQDEGKRRRIGCHICTLSSIPKLSLSTDYVSCVDHLRADLHLITCNL